MTDHLQPVQSTAIAAIGYSQGQLDIQYHSGRIYRYYQVPAELFTELKEAASKGRFVSRFIRGVFPFDLLKDAKPLQMAG